MQIHDIIPVNLILEESEILELICGNLGIDGPMGAFCTVAQHIKALLMAI